MANSPFIKQDYKGILDAPKPRRSFAHLSIVAFGIAALTGGVLFTTLTADAGSSKKILENNILASDITLSPAPADIPEPTVKLMQLSLPNQGPAASQNDDSTPTEEQLALITPANRDSGTSASQPASDARQDAIEALSQTQLVPTEQPGTWKEATVQSGDSLARIFSRLGLSATELHHIVHSGEAAEALKRIHPGQLLRFRVSADNHVLELRFKKDRLNSLQILAGADGYTSQEIARDPDHISAHAVGTIENSLFLAAQDAGLSDSVTMELAGIFGWDIDFALDIRQGDRFSVLYDDLYLDGEKIGHGDILAAEFVNQGRVYRAVRYETPEGEVGYYTPDGKSMRKAFLRTPVALARISSRFNLKRKHPVLNRIRAHKGVDYAAPYGTPIKATGDGKVILAGVKGGYGNAVVLQHGSTYSTLYAHMSRFAKGIRNGVRVKQGQTIGYIGSSGLATGPHLHYEFRVNGVHRNPLTVSLPAASPVAKQYQSDFEKKTQALLARLELVTDRETQVAFNNP